MPFFANETDGEGWLKYCGRAAQVWRDRPTPHVPWRTGGPTLWEAASSLDSEIVFENRV